MLFPKGASIPRVAHLATVAHEEWMQDWPIEVGDADRLPEFLGLLETHRDDWEVTFWFLDLVLASAQMNLERWPSRLVETIVLAVGATRSPSLMERLRYWACWDDALEDAFEVSPAVREALERLT